MGPASIFRWRSMKHSCYTGALLNMKCTILCQDRKIKHFKQFFYIQYRGVHSVTNMTDGKYLKQVLYEMHEWRRTWQLTFQDWE